MSPFILLIVILSHSRPSSVSMREFPTEADCQRASTIVMTALPISDTSVTMRCIEVGR